MRAIIAVLSATLIAAVAFAEPVEVPLKNPSFEGDVAENGVPEGWKLYAGVGSTVRVVDGGIDGGKALLIDDANPGGEVGVTQDFPLEGGQNALVRVSVRRATDAPTTGAYLQFRFFPSNTFRQTDLTAESADSYTEIEMMVQVPEGDRTGRIYLYSHDGPTPKVMVDNVSIQAGVEAPKFPDGPAPDPTPPQYDALKDLHLQTALVAEGEARAAIVTGTDGLYAAEATAIQQAIAEMTGVEIPIVADAEALPPFDRNAILLGRRETNVAIEKMYEHFCTLVDLRYPGPGGHVVRSVHNPYADGRNAIVVGASEDAQVAAAAEALVALLREAGGAEGELAVDQIAEIALSEQYDVPKDPTEMQIWEASQTYGSSGYFGWNAISKHMAAYYMTGDRYHAEEFLRLSFPDEEAIAELEELDGERIENKHDPLAGPYHYSAHMMILFWDLIEEDPFFTDEQRLEITNALSRQLTHRAHEGVYGRTTPSASVGNRHGDWSAMSLYVLARYFNRDYPAPVWDAAKTSAEIYFDGIEHSAWLAGNNDHLFWYTSYYDPLLDYMHLSGDFGGMENLEQALKTQDILFTGQESSERDWGLRASSLNFLHRAADITGDGRFAFYRDRTGLDLDVFRLGQSWWPTIDARPPTELLDTWTMQPMPEPMWKARGSGLPLEQQFLWGTWRTTLDGTGDLMMIKGHNGGGRLPYHTFAVMEQRMADYTLLKGYRNQVLTSADGMVEPQVAMDAALLDHGVLADTVYAIGEVPKMAFANWRRSVIQRTGQYTLFVDDLTFRTDSDNVKVETEWQTIGGHWEAERNAMVIGGSSGRPQEDLADFPALEAVITCGPGTEEELLSDLTSIDTMLLKAHEPGVWMEMPFTLEEPVTGHVLADLLNHTDRGIISIALDGETLVERYDHRAPATVAAQVDLGEHTLAAGEHTLRIEVVEGHEDADPMFVGLVGVSIQPESAEAAPPLSFELHPSRVMNASGSGTVVMEWLGTATEGQHRRFFHLLAPKRGEEPLEAYQIDESAAVLSLPQPALAVSGEFEGIVADAALLAGDHMVALGLTALPFATASAPVDLRWTYDDGTLIAEADEATELTISEDQFALEPGTNTLEDVPVPEVGWLDRVKGYLEAARADRDQELAAAGQPEAIEAPELTPAAAGSIGAKPVAAEVIPRDSGDLVALAEGQTVHLIATDGSEVRALQADGPVRVLRWWAAPGLLLVGCEDEQVIAFDIGSGERKWVFTSEMDRAVWEAGKQYWFKSAYPGIHGLHSGMFGDQELAFVGSACTLEILSPEGELVKRLPIFWGNGWKFEILHGTEGEPDRLLVARWPNGSDNLAVVTSDGLKEAGKSFYGVPEGHTMVGGWTAQNRTGFEYVDVDGDGENELVSVTNGVWNRVTVFSKEGAPEFNAQFGPGDNAAPYRTMRDMGVADLDGDGDMEIVVGTADGLIVTLDHQCEKVRAKRLPSAPTRLEIITPDGGAPTIVVGTEDGSIVRMTGDGEIRALGDAGGRVETLVTAHSAQGAMVFAATADGAVSGYAVE